MSIRALHLNSDRRMVSAVLAVSLVPAVWYVRTDIALYGADWQHLRTRLATRGILIAICLVGFALMRSATTRERYSRVVLGLSLTMATFIVVINALRPKGATLPLRTPLFNLFVMYGAMPNTLWKQAMAPLLVSAGLILLRLTWVTSGADGDIAGDILIVIMINVAGVVMIRRRIELEDVVDVAYELEHDARVNADRALAELRTLRGIIPICAHCKQVRTDVGDWQLLERYVATHSDAEFSHGICPTCLGAHYAELFTPDGSARAP